MAVRVVPVNSRSNLVKGRVGVENIGGEILTAALHAIQRDVIAHAERTPRFGDACRYLDEAIKLLETTREALFEPEIHRTAGEVAIRSRNPDSAKAEAYFQRALAVARHQRAKSWELRAAMSMARLWRNQARLFSLRSF